MGAGTAGLIYSAAQERKARRQLAQLDQAESGTILSAAARQRVARQETDAQNATDAAARSTAAALKAAQEAGGSRAVQSASPLVSRMEQEAVANQLGRFGEMGARLSAQSDADLLMASQARTAPQRQNLMAAADAARQGSLTSLGMLAGGIAQVAGGIGPKSQEDTGGDVTSERRLKASTIGGGFGTPQAGEAADEVSSKKTFISEQGGKPVKTPGAFSHKSNPIDVIKDGKKIAEMTGGEYIFNPKQSEKLKSLSAGGNSALHKFVRDLLSKRQFK